MPHVRSIWNGAISFGLVSIPIKLVNATESHSISFRQIHTDDGADIYVQYFGVVEYNEAAVGANEGKGSSDYPDHYFRTAPRLETGDPRYEWVNRTLFVAEGRLHPGPVVEYRVYRVL